ncbi:ribonuclease P [Cucurbitaria berberidis CBS 394.84]|uniref:Ribonuclease P n=1 Tax=Cucurbitaria berberidis CBS 394.84 TaxID=1168544 RepID=A0A9P4G8U7_9PLEO|nr:ribonuclease P [Cucurbitaria berberidis CBS 394.84]KAF1841187.1 ribonuclease P [Cucurbitaria berberidis CBS 394.84]
MELDRPTYERSGLQGVSIEDGGKKHQKQRWIVEYDLRPASMQHGKKSFSRLEWACKNVLDHSLTWLFYNFNASSAEALAEGKEVISKHAPWIHRFEPSVTHMKDVLVPKLSTGDLADLYAEEDALSLLEYLHMLNLNSPRVYQGDEINPHLSRYEVPEFSSASVSKHLARISWKGFISPDFVKDLFLMVRKQGFKGNNRVNGGQDVDMGGDSTQEGDGKEERWFSISAQEFGGKRGWTVMQFAGRETLVWEMES